MRQLPWIALALAACGGGGGGDGGGKDDPVETDADTDADADADADTDADTDTDTEPLATATVGAAGGTLAGGGATLDVPAGALAADTELSVAWSAPTGSEPDAASVHADLYDFGPDGTTFAVPATLGLPFTGTPGTGESAIVSWLDGDTWVDLPTTVAGNTATAQVAHFTIFTVRFGQVVAGQCDPVAPCGGSVQGTWRYDSYCSLEVAENPFAGDCPTAPPAEYAVTPDGTVTFAADGTYVADLTFSGELRFGIPGACLGGLACAQLGCADDGAGGCACAFPIDDTTHESGTWRVNGTSATLTEDGGEVHEEQFCVSGDTLRAHDDLDQSVVELTRL